MTTAQQAEAMLLGMTCHDCENSIPLLGKKCPYRRAFVAAAKRGVALPPNRHPICPMFRKIETWRWREHP